MNSNLQIANHISGIKFVETDVYFLPQVSETQT